MSTDERFGYDYTPPEPLPNHVDKNDCSCITCKLERFILVLDRIEAEQAQKFSDEQQQEREERNTD